MVELRHPSVEEHEKFSPSLFFLTVLISLVSLLGLVYLIGSKKVWQEQISIAPIRLLVPFLTIMLFDCFVEWVFHRYVLHKPVVPLLSRFYKQHTLHHNLTRIGKRRTTAGHSVPFVENIFPIMEAHQGEASFFPWYTLAIFGAIITPLLMAAQWLLPMFPWFIGGYSALAASLIIYEVFHAIEHWPFEKWEPLIEHPRYGVIWRKVYSFHLRHHAVIDCNEAISGFLTLPVADWVFGTFVLPKTLYADGAEWQASDFHSPRPRALVRWLDTTTDRIVKRRRSAAAN
jgi:hemolysin III